MLYSVRMRAAQGAAHESGGRHISGAERIVNSRQITATAQLMIERALNHSRGQSDFVQITIESISEQAVKQVNVLPIQSVTVPDVMAGRAAAREELMTAGVTAKAVDCGMAMLSALPDSMRGALVICAESGSRLDNRGERGIRVSRMDVAGEERYNTWLSRQGYTNIHIREAVVLASKVVSADEVVAELCWSDDPEYTAGYVATKAGYTRFTYLKEYGSHVGGRIFFVEADTDLEQLAIYLESQPVLIQVPAGEV